METNRFRKRAIGMLAATVTAIGLGAVLASSHESSSAPDGATCNSVIIKHAGGSALEAVAQYSTQGGAEVVDVKYIFAPSPYDGNSHNTVTAQPGVPAKLPAGVSPAAAVFAILDVNVDDQIAQITSGTCSAPLPG